MWKKGRVVFMTCSGTGSMEASVMNLFTSKDTVLIILVEPLELA